MGAANRCTRIASWATVALALGGVLVAIGACGEATSGLAVAAGDSAAVPASRASASELDAALGAIDLVPPVAVPATNAVVQLPFDVSIEQAGPHSDVSIRHNVGWFVPPGTSEPIPVLVYSRIDWEWSGFTLYAGLGVTATAWIPVWFYCNGADDLRVVYQSTADGQLSAAYARGTCTEGTPASALQVQLPVSTVAIGSPVTGFTVSGPELSIDASGRGTMALGGSMWNFSPFAMVDCTFACGAPGWYELHALYWRPDAPDLCFGILYLFPDSDGASLHYSMCLPSVTDPTGGGVGFDASWAISG